MTATGSLPTDEQTSQEVAFQQTVDADGRVGRATPARWHRTSSCCSGRPAT